MSGQYDDSNRKHRRSSCQNQLVNLHRTMHNDLPKRICLLVVALFFAFLCAAQFFGAWRYRDIPLSILPPQYACSTKQVPSPNAPTQAGRTSKDAVSKDRLSRANPIPCSRHPFTTTLHQPQSQPTRAGERPATTAHVHVTFAVVSTCSNTKLRQAIRDTWGRRAVALGGKVIFFVGSHSSCLEAVTKENHIYRDVVVLDVPESYAHLSLKTRAMLTYLHDTPSLERRGPSQYIAKVDDDVFIDVEAFLGRMRLFQSKPYLYLGYQHTSTCVIRLNRCKWFDPSYPSTQTVGATVFGLQTKRKDVILAPGCVDAYPSYAGGMFYVLSHSILSLLSLYDPVLQQFVHAAESNAKTKSSSTTKGQPKRSIANLPVWSNEDATVGTWVHAAMRHVRNDYASATIHEPTIFPSRMVPTGSPPPMVIHMEWATGQHVKRKGDSNTKETMKAALLYAAEANLKAEGVAMGCCQLGIRSSVQKDGTIVHHQVKTHDTKEQSEDEKSNAHSSVPSSLAANTPVFGSNSKRFFRERPGLDRKRVDVYNRHFLYEKPTDMYQIESAAKLEKLCSGLN